MVEEVSSTITAFCVCRCSGAASNGFRCSVMNLSPVCCDSTHPAGVFSTIEERSFRKWLLCRVWHYTASTRCQRRWMPRRCTFLPECRGLLGSFVKRVLCVWYKAQSSELTVEFRLCCFQKWRAPALHPQWKQENHYWFLSGTKVEQLLCLAFKVWLQHLADGPHQTLNQ